MGSLVRHGRDAGGQYYRRNRYYDAGTGRFTQEDPIGLAGGINLYGYANGDPVTYADPYGLSACPIGNSTTNERDTNVDDCDDGPLAKAFHLLKNHGGGDGEVTLHTIATHGIAIHLGSQSTVHFNCRSATNGCYDLGTNIIHMVDAGAVDNAVRLTHEAGGHAMVHLASPRNAHESRMPYEEPRAWEKALRVYGRLQAAGKASSVFYHPMYQQWASRHQEWMNNFCTNMGVCP
jgi:RHS repeat-associated protein